MQDGTSDGEIPKFDGAAYDKDLVEAREDKLQPMGWQRVGYDLATEQQSSCKTWEHSLACIFLTYILLIKS